MLHVINTKTFKENMCYTLLILKPLRKTMNCIFAKIMKPRVNVSFFLCILKRFILESKVGKCKSSNITLQVSFSIEF